MQFFRITTVSVQSGGEPRASSFAYSDSHSDQSITVCGVLYHDSKIQATLENIQSLRGMADTLEKILKANQPVLDSTIDDCPF